MISRILNSLILFAWLLFDSSTLLAGPPARQVESRDDSANPEVPLSRGNHARVPQARSPEELENSPLDVRPISCDHPSYSAVDEARLGIIKYATPRKNKLAGWCEMPPVSDPWRLPPRPSR